MWQRRKYANSEPKPYEGLATVLLHSGDKSCRVVSTAILLEKPAGEGEAVRLRERAAQPSGLNPAFQPSPPRLQTTPRCAQLAHSGPVNPQNQETQ